MGAILDRIGNLCLRAASLCFTAREALDPLPDDSDLTPDRSDAIMAGILAALESPYYQPSPDAITAASLAASIGATVWIHRTPEGRIVAAAQRNPGGM